MDRKKKTKEKRQDVGIKESSGEGELFRPKVKEHTEGGAESLYGEVITWETSLC